MTFKEFMHHRRVAEEHNTVNGHKRMPTEFGHIQKKHKKKKGLVTLVDEKVNALANTSKILIKYPKSSNVFKLALIGSG